MNNTNTNTNNTNDGNNPDNWGNNVVFAPATPARNTATTTPINTPDNAPWITPARNLWTAPRPAPQNDDPFATPGRRPLQDLGPTESEHNRLPHVLAQTAPQRARQFWGGPEGNPQTPRTPATPTPMPRTEPRNGNQFTNDTPEATPVRGPYSWPPPPQTPGRNWTPADVALNEQVRQNRDNMPSIRGLR